MSNGRCGQGSNDEIGSPRPHACTTPPPSPSVLHTQDIRSEVLVGEERGFKLTFHFKADNPHFTNSVGPGGAREIRWHLTLHGAVNPLYPKTPDTTY